MKDDAPEARILHKIKAAGVTVAVAESCTGGLLGAALTALPGSTSFFVGGVIAYANEVKRRCLNVEADLLEREGAVSEPVAMARGARNALGAQVAVAVTGVAGPEGGTEQKPVGLVWIGMAGREREEARSFHFAGHREQIRKAACQAALVWLESFVVTENKEKNHDRQT